MTYEVRYEKYKKAAIILISASLLALTACDAELSDEEKAARFTYPDKNGEASKITYNAGDTFEAGGFLFTVKKNDEAEVTSYRGAAASVTVPEEEEGFTVTSVAKEAFFENTALSAVNLPDTVSEIGDNAFRGCVNLVNVTGCRNVTKVGRHAFSETAIASYSDEDFVTVGDDILIAYKGSAKDAVIPEGIRIISTAFAGRGDITSVTIAKSVEYIGAGAFEEMTALGEVDIPYAVKYVGDGAFSGCIALKYVYIPYAVSEFGEGILEGCSAELTVQCTEGSPADVYCRNNGIKAVY